MNILNPQLFSKILDQKILFHLYTIEYKFNATNQALPGEKFNLTRQK